MRKRLTLSEIPAKVYQNLANKINDQTNGCEISSGEAETSFNGILYMVEYTVKREYNDVFIDYDTETGHESSVTVTIEDYSIFDSEGEKIDMTMNTDEILSYFRP